MYAKEFKSILIALFILGIVSCDSISLKDEDSLDLSTSYDRRYVFDIESLPEITFNVRTEEWDSLLMKYDENKNVKDYIKCVFSFRKDGLETIIPDAGLRLHGNTSRRRPEGVTGQKHGDPETIFNHCHYMVNVRRYVKDDEHELFGVRKINFKWFHNDPSYVREIYCYDLFRRYGIWTIGNSSYCRISIKVDDEEPVYLGVYGMFEVVDKQYLKQRKSLFGDASGFLWKCAGGLNDTNDDLFCIDNNSTEEYPYELKTNIGEFETAKKQFKSFINTFNELQGDEFVNWISSVCDVELLLKTYAVNVACGMWDDYWNNSNNYYVYFNSKDERQYKIYFIPYDYDESLGRTSICGIQTDAVIHDPLRWGKNENELISKIISYPMFRTIYVNSLLELSSPEAMLLDYDSSVERINKWHNLIHSYVANDTYQDMIVEDLPGMYSSQQEYKLWNIDNNYFKIKCENLHSCLQ